jgi:hypothetical protein
MLRCTHWMATRRPILRNGCEGNWPASPPAEILNRFLRLIRIIGEIPGAPNAPAAPLHTERTSIGWDKISGAEGPLVDWEVNAGWILPDDAVIIVAKAPEKGSADPGPAVKAAGIV